MDVDGTTLFRQEFNQWLKTHMDQSRKNAWMIDKERAEKIKRVLKGGDTDNRFKQTVREARYGLMTVPGEDEALYKEIKQKQPGQDTLPMGLNRKVAIAEDYFDILLQIHADDRHHCGVLRTFKAVVDQYACLTRKVVEKFVDLCPVCHRKKPQVETPPIRPIITPRVNGRCQNMASVCTEAKPDGVTIIKEGQAEILFPSSNEVFYNPVQEFNRDISTAVICMFGEEQLNKKSTQVTYSARKESVVVKTDTDDQEDVAMATTEVAAPENTADDTIEKTSEPKQLKTDESSSSPEMAFLGEKCENGLRILEGLAASGLRSIRYAKEIPGVKEVIANDFSEKAVENIQRNIKHNGVEDRVTASRADAALLMYQNKSFSDRFDVIDLDPYGTAAPFFDGAVQAVQNGGLLCITCTDSAILCGNHAEACYGKYGAMSLQTKYSHEMALRIVLHALETTANRYQRHIVPILSLSVDFYVRVFVRVYTSAATVKLSASKQALVYHCLGCASFHLQRMGKVMHREDKPPKFSPATGPPIGPKCENCGGIFKVGGPIWADSIHQQDFVLKLLSHVKKYPHRYNTSDRIIGVLSVISEELPDCPLYHTVSHLSNIIHTRMMSQVVFRSALLHAGYRVSITHTSAEALKTDAPNLVVWDIMRAWVKLNPVTKKNISDTSPAAAILKKESSTEVCFDVRADAKPKSRQQRGKITRFPLNPQKNWGPKARAKPSASNSQEPLVERRARLQGKNKHKRSAGHDDKKEEHEQSRQAKKQKQESDECRMSQELNEDATSGL